MKCLLIGGNRFIGLRLSLLLEKYPGCELHILNRTGQAPHCRSAVVYKGDRRSLSSTHLDRDWDVIYDFACFNDADAQASREYFGKVGYYVFISSASVYSSTSGLGGAAEMAFDPRKLDLSRPLQNTYQDGKQRAEADYIQRAAFPVLSVRFPFVLGPDDYTRRLNFHVEHTQRGEPIYVPNPKARISMLHSEDAAHFLFWSLGAKPEGPLNVASQTPISLSHLLGQVQLGVGRKPILASSETPENVSPYGVTDDLVLDVGKMERAGFQTRPIAEWLPKLLGALPPGGPQGYLH